MPTSQIAAMIRHLVSASRAMHESSTRFKRPQPQLLFVRPNSLVTNVQWDTHPRFGAVKKDPIVMSVSCKYLVILRTYSGHTPYTASHGVKPEKFRPFQPRSHASVSGCTCVGSQFWVCVTNMTKKIDFGCSRSP
jgi:hypothetical protein